MRPIFTIHAGEFIVGTYLKRKFKNINLWIPTDDSGIDLLLSNRENNKTVTLQIKFSRDYSEGYEKKYIKEVKACGWWSLNASKIKNSKADFWVFVLHSYSKLPFDYIIIKPKELYQNLKRLHSAAHRFECYLWVMRNNKCWETRGFKAEDKEGICSHKYRNYRRDFSRYLNNWESVINLLK